MAGDWPSAYAAQSNPTLPDETIARFANENSALEVTLRIRAFPSSEPSGGVLAAHVESQFAPTAERVHPVDSPGTANRVEATSTSSALRAAGAMPVQMVLSRNKMLL